MYVWKKSKDPRVASLGAGADFRVLRDSSGKILGYTVTDARRIAEKKPPLKFGPDEVTVKVDAAFNETGTSVVIDAAQLASTPIPRLCTGQPGSFWLPDAHTS